MGTAVDELTALIDARVAAAMAEREKARVQFWRRIWRGLTAVTRAIEDEYAVRPKTQGATGEEAHDVRE
jgi:hypothetical protein